MAEQQKQPSVKKLIAGMNTDLNPIDQFPGTYRYALNATTGRDIGAISNEEGNIVYSTISSGFQAIGSIVVNDLTSGVQFVIFSCTGTVSEIGTIDLDGNYAVVLMIVDLLINLIFQAGIL